MTVAAAAVAAAAMTIAAMKRRTTILVRMTKASDQISATPKRAAEGCSADRYRYRLRVQRRQDAALAGPDHQRDDGEEPGDER